MNYLWQTLISEDSIVDGNNCRHSFNSKFGTTEYVGLYFSASWCKPCQEFKEHFQQWYKSFKLNHGESYFQVLFISSDESVESFNTNMQHVPWFALPYEHRKLKVQLTKKYKVATIPALVILERATGKVVCSNARRELMEDPEGTNFPWSVTSVKELIDGPLLRGSQLVQAEDVLEKSVIALFFSAHWCPPCREVSKNLESLYTKLGNKSFEVLYISSDKSEKTFDDYYSTMPWLAIPYGDKRIGLLLKRFQIDGIPAVVLLDSKFEPISTNGRHIISEDPEGKNFPWPPTVVQQLTSSAASLLNHTTALVYFTGGKTMYIEQALNAMQSVAANYEEERSANEDLPELLFLYQGKENEDIADSLRGILRLDDDVPQLVVCDLPEQQFHLCLSDNITRDVIKQIIADLKAGQLLFTPLGN